MAGKKTNNVSKELIDSLLEDIQVDESSLHLSENELDPYAEDDSEIVPNVDHYHSENNDSLDLDLNISAVAMDNLKSNAIEKSATAKPATKPEEDISIESVEMDSYKDLLERDAMNPQYERQANFSEPATANENQSAIANHDTHDSNEKTQQMTVGDNTKPSNAHSQQEFPTSSEIEKTIAVGQYANRNANNNNDNVRVTPGTVRSSQKAGQVFTSADASLLQAENLRIAQQRILDLEKEVDQLRQENEELSSAAEIIKMRSDDLSAQLNNIQRSKTESEEHLKNEILILKGNLQYKDDELSQAKLKVEELDSRLKLDLKKIRVRERELENRLELARSEKNALVRSKDENILDLKRKVDQMQNELDNYRQKCLELNKSLENNHESFKKTTRALRLALANLELSDDVKATLKKAE